MLVNSVSKSDGPFIQINFISIDLVSAKEKSDAGKLSLLPNHVIIFQICVVEFLFFCKKTFYVSQNYKSY